MALIQRVVGTVFSALERVGAAVDHVAGGSAFSRKRRRSEGPADADVHADADADAAAAAFHGLAAARISRLPALTPARGSAGAPPSPHGLAQAQHTPAYGWRNSMPVGHGRARLSTGSSLATPTLQRNESMFAARAAVHRPESLLAKLERHSISKHYLRREAQRRSKAHAHRLRAAGPFGGRRASLPARAANGHPFRRQPPQRDPLAAPLNGAITKAERRSGHTALRRASATATYHRPTSSPVSATAHRRDSWLSSQPVTPAPPRTPAPAAKRPRAVSRVVVSPVPSDDDDVTPSTPMRRAPQAINVAKMVNIPRADLIDVLSEGLVTLMESNPLFAEKVLRQHADKLTDYIRAKTRRNEQTRRIKDAEHQLIKLRAEAQVRMKTFIHDNAVRHAALSNGNHADNPPEDSDPRWNEDYFTATGPFEEDLEEATKEEGSQTVVDETSAFSELTDLAKVRVANVLGAEPTPQFRQQLLVKIKGCRITGNDIQMLQPNTWLNDEVVNAYMELLAQRSLKYLEKAANGAGASASAPKHLNVRCVSSFFYTKLYQVNRNLGQHEYDYSRVRRWTRRFNAFECDRLIVPVNQHNMHWTLAVVNFSEKRVEHYDSFGGGGAGTILSNMLQWVRDESEDKRQTPLEDGWTTKEMTPDLPQQNNSDDCGVFVCKFADFLARDEPINFRPVHMNYFRARIAHEILFQRVTP